MIVVLREEDPYRAARAWCGVCGVRLTAPALDVWRTECSQVCADSIKAQRRRESEDDYTVPERALTGRRTA